MFDDEYSFVFTLAKGYSSTSTVEGQTTTDGDQLVMVGDGRYSTNKRNYYLCNTAYQGSNYTHYLNGYIVGTISETEDGGYKITFPSFSLRNRNDGNLLSNMEQYDGYELEVIKTNATITETGYDIYNGGYLFRNRKFQGKLTINPDNTFELLGLSQTGYAINKQNQLVPVTGVLYDDNTLRIDSHQHMLFAEEAYTRYGYTYYSWADYQLMEMDAEGELYYSVDGTYTMNDELSHNGVHRWVTNDGDCTTSYGLKIKLNDYTFVSVPNDNIYGEVLITYLSENTTIDCGYDKTLDVTLNLIEYDADEKDVYARGEVVSNKNFEHVSKYEVYMVPGNHSSINHHVGFRQNHEDGHTNAMLIYSKDMTDYNHVNKEPQATFAAERASENPADLGFEVRIPRTAIENAHGAFNRYNTLYVKAYYDNGLEPTFHDMRYKATVTGITELVSAADVDIKALPGAIFVDETELTVNIFTPSGMMVYTGQAGTIPVAAGIYIVKVGNQTAKLVVK